MNIELKQTCHACPEQYDAVLNGKVIGYLRLRHGIFTCEHIPSGVHVYVGDPKGDGIFEPEEREFHLNKALNALAVAEDRSNREAMTPTQERYFDPS